MGRVFVFGMAGLVLIGLVYLSIFIAPIAYRWVRRIGK